MVAVGNLFAGNEKPAASQNSFEEQLGLDSNMHHNSASNVVSPEHDFKRVVVLISSGAAAGAVIGSAAGKTAKSAMIGAVLGGVAGLIYDRISHAKEEKPAQVAQLSGPVDRLGDGTVRNNLTCSDMGCPVLVPVP